LLLKLNFTVSTKYPGSNLTNMGTHSNPLIGQASSSFCVAHTLGTEKKNSGFILVRHQMRY